MTELLEPGLKLSLNLDRRQRAMLKEMGVQVWQPVPAVAPVAVTAAVTAAETAAVTQAAKQAVTPPPSAIISGAARARIQGAADTFETQKEPAATEPESLSAAAWRIGKLQTLYPQTAVPQAARWLILIESPASALQDGFMPFDGDAGKLLDNMLRAARLHTAGAVMLAPLVRGAGTGGNLNIELANLLASAQADVVVSMGRLASQAVLQSAEPLAKLRGQVHSVAGSQTIITIDPAYLLRNPLDKSKAWDDLCLAVSVARQAPTRYK